jgi:hypothetical protein
MSGIENIPIGGRRPDNVVPLPSTQTEQTAATPPEEPAEPLSSSAPAELAAIAEDALQIAVGFGSAGAAALARAFDRAVPRPEPEFGEEDALPAAPSSLTQTAGALAELAVELATAAIHAMASVADAALPTLSWLTSPAVVRHRMDRVGEAAARLNGRFADARPGAEELAGAFAAELIPEIAGAVLDRLDLTELVLERVEFERILDAIDVDAVVAEVDLDSIVARIDVNEVAKGIDVAAVVERIDLAALAEQVIAEIDLPEIIRASTMAVSSQTMRTVRVVSAEGDRAIQRVVDGLLRRSGERDTDAREETH